MLDGFFYVSEIAGEFHGHLGVGWILKRTKKKVRIVRG